MTFDIDINGRVKNVSLQPIGANGPTSDHVRVTVDGQAREVRVTSTELGLAVLFDDGRSLDAAVTERAFGEWFVQLPRVDVSASVDGLRFGRGRRASASVKSDQRVSAPMPGRIVRVLVRAGDAVTAGQPLVVVEAMKMENELKSPRAGRVKEVSVGEGTSIEAGRLLVVVE